MYDELISSLREEAEWAAGNEWETPIMLYDHLKQAADAIETLNSRETPMKITEIHVDEYFCPACGAENNCDHGHVQDAFCPACWQRLLPQPPKWER